MKQTFQESEINQLKEIVDKFKSQGKTIVWTNGCFDIIHPGHLETFKKAKELGNIVIVGLNGDKNPYWKTKPGRPINDEIFRSKMLEGIKYVDFIYIFNDENPAKAVDILKPDYVLKGGDYYLGKGIVNSEKGITKDNKIKHLLENNQNFIQKYNGVLNITGIYEYILENNLEEEARKLSGFMPEGLVNVKNGGKVVLVPVIGNYSTSSIVEKIRPKKFFDLVIFWKNFKEKFKDLKDFISWYKEKLDIHYFHHKYDHIKFKQFDIYLANLGKNIGGEINKTRPVLIVGKTRKFLKSKTLLMAPFTSYYQNDGKKKNILSRDIVIKASSVNNLGKDSILRIRKVREISRKRIIHKLGKLENDYILKVKEKLKEIFGI